jgi:hypothetical protein
MELDKIADALDTMKAYEWERYKLASPGADKTAARLRYDAAANASIYIRIYQGMFGEQVR